VAANKSRQTLETVLAIDRAGSRSIGANRQACAQNGAIVQKCTISDDSAERAANGGVLTIRLTEKSGMLRAQYAS
jgi:hypothetical protein